MINYLQVENLTKSFGDLILFQNISFTINKDDKTALIAKNGVGKTSLLNIIASLDTSDSGIVTFKNDIKIGYLSQEPKLAEEKTVLEQVLSASNEATKAIKKYELAIASNNKDEISEATILIDNLNAWDYEVRIKQILTILNITDFEAKIKHLSGGQRKRVALAEVIIQEPDLIILDEPTNHLDTSMIEWLEEYLRKTNSTLLMVTHDRYFLDRVCTEIIELEDNQIYKYQGNYNYYIEKREERIALLNLSIEKATNTLRTEQEWMRRMPKARGTKAKYRIDNFYKIKEVASQRIDDSKLEIGISNRRLGKKIIEINNVSKSLSNKILFQNFSYLFSQSEKIGIVGPNGSGKSTFLNVITQLLQPDCGTIEIGETLVIGYYHQQGIKFEQDMRVVDVIKEIAEVVTLGNGKQISALQFLEHFMFSKEKHYTPIEKLSGGEKRRLYLMTVLMRNPNFLILDEPTNDLDIMTLNVLEDYLANFNGCVLAVSHDRFFLDKFSQFTFAFDGKGNIENFPGTYSDFYEYKKQLETEEKKLEKKEPEKKEKIKQEKKKLTFKEKQEFEQLEKDIEKLNKEKLDLENLVNSGSIHFSEVLKKTNRIKELTQIIDEKEMRWLELSEI